MFLAFFPDANTSTENKKLNDDNQYMAGSLQTQMSTTNTAALEKRQELEINLANVYNPLIT